MPIYKMEGKKDGLQKYRVRINYVDRDGKNRQLDRVAYGRDEAKELEIRLIKDLREETVKKITLQELYNEYIKVKQFEVRETTLDKNKKLLKAYIIPYFNNKKLNSITISTLQRWKTYIEQQTTSDGSPFSLGYKKKIYSVFIALLNYAVKMEYIDRNLLSALGNFKDVNAIKSDIDFYMPNEFLKYIKVSRDFAKQMEKDTNNIREWYFYIFFNIAFYTGLRKGEINALKWTDIKNNTIYVTRSISQTLKGKDRETPPKNKSSIRSIQIPIPLKKALDEHYNRCQQLSGFNDDWRICGGAICLRDSAIDKHNYLYAKTANIKRIRIHDFRHSHASLLANSGINIQEIARRLGHTNIEMTWNTYSHLYPKEEEKALEILNKIE